MNLKLPWTLNSGLGHWEVLDSDGKKIMGGSIYGDHDRVPNEDLVKEMIKRLNKTK